MACLSKQSSKESYDFLSTMKEFFDNNYPGGFYDAIGRRRESKGTASTVCWMWIPYRNQQKRLSLSRSATAKYREPFRKSKRAACVFAPSERKLASLPNDHFAAFASFADKCEQRRRSDGGLRHVPSHVASRSTHAE